MSEEQMKRLVAAFEKQVIALKVMADKAVEQADVQNRMLNLMEPFLLVIQRNAPAMSKLFEQGLQQVLAGFEDQ